MILTMQKILEACPSQEHFHIIDQLEPKILNKES